MTYPIRTDLQDAADDVRALHASGHAAGIASHDGRFVALDLDGPAVDVVDALVELGLGPNRAEDEAHRRLAAGY